MSGTELMAGTSHHEHEPAVNECTAQQTHIYINEEQFDDRVLVKLMNNSLNLNKGNRDGVNSYLY